MNDRTRVLLAWAIVAMLALSLRAADDKRLYEASEANVEKIVLAVLEYDGVHGSLPPQALLSPTGKPHLSWRVVLLPHLGDDAKKLYEEFALNEPWDSPRNKKLLTRMPKVYAPVAKAPKEPGGTYYQVCTGPGTPYPEAKLTGPRRFTFRDGLANTLLVVEAGEAVPWTKPADLVIDPKKPLPKFGGMFDKAFHVGMMDGTVKRVRRDFDEATMRLVIDPDDRTVLDFEKVEAKR